MRAPRRNVLIVVCMLVFAGAMDPGRVVLANSTNEWTLSRDPARDVLFGDLHIHGSWSVDGKAVASMELGDPMYNCARQRVSLITVIEIVGDRLC